MRIKERLSSIKRAIAIWIDQTRLVQFLYIFALGIVVFGSVYYILTQCGQGLASTTTPPTEITPWTSIYFSVVTISTLGYGDIVPKGVSKFLVCAEVLFGLTIMGIIVAKLTSGRLSYHVRRLFRTDIQKRLEAYLLDFETVRDTFALLSPRINTAFQETPNAAPSNQQATCITEFRRTLNNLHLRTSNFCREIIYETEQGDFFGEAPIDILEKTAAEIEQSLFRLGQLILSLPISARPILLDAENRRRISEIIEYLTHLNRTASQHCRVEQLRQTFAQIAERCDSIPAHYFSVPVGVEDRGQPDLVVPKIDEPQISQ